MSQHHYETADFGEPLEVEDTIRVTAFRHGERIRYRFERLSPPISVKRPGKSVDFSLPDSQTMGDSTI